MTADILLIRHAAHAHLGHTLSGRASGISLSTEGVAQARRLADRLQNERLDEVHSSPVRRARETAAIIVEGRRIDVTLAEPLEEVDFGTWTGQRFTDLEQDPQWRDWNERRAEGQAPGGETMAAVQQRVLAHLRNVATAAAGKIIAMVSHCDVIRAAVAGVLGLSLDRLLQFDVAPASVSRIRIGDWGERIVTLNEGGA